MKNLTPKQNEIIGSLVEQFEKLNKPKEACLTNPLKAYYDALKWEREKESLDRANIEASNEAYRKANRHEACLAAEYLHELINEVGDGLSVELKHYNNYSTIRFSRECHWMSTIYFALHESDGPEYKYSDSVVILGNPQISYLGVEYYNIDEVINSGDFSRDFTGLLNY